MYDLKTNAKKSEWENVPVACKEKRLMGDFSTRIANYIEGRVDCMKNGIVCGLNDEKYSLTGLYAQSF